jgi:hypothetical protein
MAGKIQHVLAGHGIPVWYSAVNIVGAQQWHDEIGAALRRCDWFLLLLSPDAIRSTWVRRELMYVLGQNRYDGRIIPLRYGGVQDREIEAFSWTLFAFQMIDLDIDREEAFRQLLRVWGVGLKSEFLASIV